MLAVRCLRTATNWTSVIRIIAVPLNGSLILHFMGVDSGMSIVKHNWTFLPINCHWFGTLETEPVTRCLVGKKKRYGHKGKEDLSQKNYFTSRIRIVS